MIIAKTTTVNTDSGQGATIPVTERKINVNGFPLRGADNEGACYYVNTKVNNKDEEEKLTDSYSGVLTQKIIENSDVKTYYEDPVLTFDDSLIYGCNIELDHAQFKEFCSNNLFHNLMIYQNLFLLDSVGVSGNADIHYDLDW